MKYQILLERVKQKGCILKWNEQEFFEMYKDTKTNIPIISSCGHDTIVQCSNFLYIGTGVTCKECLYQRSRECKTGKDSLLQEYNVINAIQEFCKGEIEMKNLREGCFADFCLRPKDTKEDKWLSIQVKTTLKKNFGIYAFSLNKSYGDIHVLCYCIEEQRIWLFKGVNVSVTKLNIGVKNSVYSKYEIHSDSLVDVLLSLYDTENTDCFEQINQPISNAAKREVEFSEFREKLFPELMFEYPEIQNRHYDCIVNKKYRVQDKVITQTLRRQRKDKPMFVVNLYRNRNKRDIQYKLGDNDYYYFHLPDKTGAYIIPENLLYQHNLVSNQEDDIVGHMVILYPHYDKNQLDNVKAGWMNNHLYMYSTDIERIEKLFDGVDKPTIVNEYENPIKILKNIHIFKENKGKPPKEKESSVVEEPPKEEKPPKEPKHKCTDCGKALPKKGERCYDCHKIHKISLRKVERPTLEQLQKDLSEMSMVKVGKKYNVSDNCIRKWLRIYAKQDGA